MDHMSGDGIIIFRFKVQTKQLVNIFQLGGTIYGIFMFIDLTDIVLLFFIVLIADLTHDFFQQILQGDESGNGTVFI